jgi:hypothetical protein
MKTAILHVGLHKTGTTSIQKAFTGYDDGSTAYADLGDPNHSDLFRTLFSTDHWARHWFRQGLSQEDLENLTNTLRLKLNKQLARRHSRLIFSGEDISTLSTEELRRVKKLFEQHQRQISVYIFVREPLGMTASLLQEMVKWGDSLQNESTDGDTINYRAADRVENILTVFGSDKTHFLYHEDALDSRYPRGAVDYFAETLGIRCEHLKPGKLSNQSIEETTYKLLNSFFQSGIVHNKGRMLNRVRWSFIRMLNEAVKSETNKKLDINAFRCKVNWDDYRRLNTNLPRPYAIESNPNLKSQAFSEYCNDIDHTEVCSRLSTYLQLKGVPVPSDCSTHELVSLLFYKAIQDYKPKPATARGIFSTEKRRQIKALLKDMWQLPHHIRLPPSHRKDHR